MRTNQFTVDRVDGQVRASIPSMPGVAGYGQTRREAKDNLLNALIYLHASREPNSPEEHAVRAVRTAFQTVRDIKTQFASDRLMERLREARNVR